LAAVGSKKNPFVKKIIVIFKL